MPRTDRRHSPPARRAGRPAQSASAAIGPAEVAAQLLLAASLLLGGGPRGVGDMIVYALVAPCLGLAVWQWSRHAHGRLQWLGLWMWASAALIAVAQLVPLPVDWFAALPGRVSVVADLQLAGQHPAWLPMTLDRWATVRALLAVTAAGTLWMLAVDLPAAARRRLLGTALLIGIAAALLGFAQASAGSHSRLRPFDYHHPIGAIGQFANRNHFALLMACLLPFALARMHAAQAPLRPFRDGPATAGRTAPHMAVEGIAAWRMAAWGLASVLLLLAAALSFSRAGFALASLAFVVSLAMFWGRGNGRHPSIAARRPRGARRLPPFLPLLLVLVAVLAIGNYALDGLRQRLEQDVLADLRWQYLAHGWEAAKAYFPVGSGLGSFPWVYAPFEPVSQMVAVFAERAHNDYLQLFLESGLFWAVPATCCVIIVSTGLRRSFRGPSPASPHQVEERFDWRDRRAALIASVLPLVHSSVDYPLRTLAVSALLALSLAWLCADEDR